MLSPNRVFLPIGKTFSPGVKKPSHKKFFGIAPDRRRNSSWPLPPPEQHPAANVREPYPAQAALRQMPCFRSRRHRSPESTDQPPRKTDAFLFRACQALNRLKPMIKKPGRTNVPPGHGSRSGVAGATRRCRAHRAFRTRGVPAGARRRPYRPRPAERPRTHRWKMPCPRTRR